MFTASDLIEVFRRRRRRSIRPEAANDGIPPAWSAWFASMQARRDAVTGATAAAVAAVLVARPPPPRRRRAPPRTALAAWASLAYPLWEPGPRDQRGPRLVSLVSTALIQITWLTLLFLLMNARFLAAPAPAALGDEAVIEAVFIGRGTPADTGGGAAEDAPRPVEPAVTPAPAAAAVPAAAAPAPSPEVPAPDVPVPVADVPPPGDDAAAQPLQITETRLPDIAFTLPPPRPREALPDVAVREREIAGAPAPPVEVPALRMPAVAAPPAPRPPREIQVEVRERALADIADPMPAPVVPQREVVLDAPSRPDAVAEVTARERAVPLRDPPPRPAAGTAASGADTPAAAEVRRETGQGDRAPTSTAGRGPTPGLPPGAAPSPRAADDWGDGASAREGGRQGSPSGLLGADGRPRLADGGRVGGGLPPGTITEDFANVDRHGTWLRRPPTDYEPTRFDRFWTPSETLLEEWVRRSIKTVLIPIPGTSKTIQCNVALLMFGGGCGITDPNLQDVETDGRPPPDVPWKPELQEDQESLGG